MEPMNFLEYNGNDMSDDDGNNVLEALIRDVSGPQETESNSNFSSNNHNDSVETPYNNDNTMDTPTWNDNSYNNNDINNGNNNGNYSSYSHARNNNNNSSSISSSNNNNDNFSNPNNNDNMDDFKDAKSYDRNNNNNNNHDYGFNNYSNYEAAQQQQPQQLASQSVNFSNDSSNMGKESIGIGQRTSPTYQNCRLDTNFEPYQISRNNHDDDNLNELSSSDTMNTGQTSFQDYNNTKQDYSNNNNNHNYNNDNKSNSGDGNGNMNQNYQLNNNIMGNYEQATEKNASQRQSTTTAQSTNFLTTFSQNNTSNPPNDVSNNGYYDNVQDRQYMEQQQPQDDNSRNTKQSRSRMIDLFDGDNGTRSSYQSGSQFSTNLKRQRLDESTIARASMQNTSPPPPPPSSSSSLSPPPLSSTTTFPPTTTTSKSPPTVAYLARKANMPSWMRSHPPPQSVKSSMKPPASASNPTSMHHRKSHPKYTQPSYFRLDHVPTWSKFVPDRAFTIQPRPNPPAEKVNQQKKYVLSLLNVNEFTITAFNMPYGDTAVPVAPGLGRTIRKISRDHGKPVFENSKDPNDSDDPENPDDVGKWRIPLGAYNSLHSYLCSDPNCSVVGIPENQLKVASIGRTRAEKGFPSAKALISRGVPSGLAKALAPFQRGGVDFVIDKNGRALIADDMGLGKTIQSIASMAAYHQEWPLLVLTPSSARYHWESEFQNWLGSKLQTNESDHNDDWNDANTGVRSSAVNSNNNSNNNMPCFQLQPQVMRSLEDSEINVLTSSKDAIFNNTNTTRVVICSYGLAPMLAERGALRPGMFRCAIVDESHMLKNISTKRTSLLVPVLQSTNRCVLLSGTPAFARPAELWPQLKILDTEKSGWWSNQSEFWSKYVKRNSKARRAELHTLLTGTVMIRRLKTDILKSLPPKRRQKALLDITDKQLRKEFVRCMNLLREGKGALGKLAQVHVKQNKKDYQVQNDDTPAFDLADAQMELRMEYTRKMQQGKNLIQERIQKIQNQTERYNQMNSLVSKLESETRTWYDTQERHLNEKAKEEEAKKSRTGVLNRMYNLTAEAKVPMVVDMVKRWLNDPTKGKLCLFAHHLYVLDAIVEQVGLSNNASSTKKYIRIDGSTGPKERQAQITAFQADPTIKIAVLGITAAGVAVTLTASSTVWFAELFWTPALMIQAEDRCHRIGQNSHVNCLYFVANGTLDELLWRLLEDKFQALGEFVEGKEKLKLVVHQIFKGEKELRSIFDNDNNNNIDNEFDGDTTNNDGDDDDMMPLDFDLEHDFEELGRAELRSFMNDDGDDDEAETASIVKSENNPIVKKEQSSLQPTKNNKEAKGASADAAILLSDDDDDDDNDENNNNNGGAIATTTGPAVPTPGTGAQFNLFGTLSGCRFYHIPFSKIICDFRVILCHRRIVVYKSSRNGPKPAVGDILIALNGDTIAFQDELELFRQQLRATLESGISVRLSFADDKAFAQFFQNEYLKYNKVEPVRLLPPKPVPKTQDAVIELLDD